MATLKKNEINQMNITLIKDKLQELKRELTKLNAQVTSGTRPENPGRIRAIKKTIARLLTRQKKSKEEIKKA